MPCVPGMECLECEATPPTNNSRYVDTPMTHEAIQAGIIGEQAKSISMGRFGMVEEIADSILFLASPMSSYMCGETLVVDGGLAI